MSSPLLQVKSLTVGMRINNRIVPIVDTVSFNIAQGETLGVVGESGSGKSTTGLALLKLTPPSTWPHTSGEVLFGDRNVLDMDPEELRSLRGRDISMVLQDPMASLNPAFTIGKQIEEAFAVHRRFAKSERRNQAIEALRRVRIPAPEHRLDDYPHQLSGGMKQRVVGAIALACKPRLLIADEPTTSLDVTIQAHYLDLLKELQLEMGMSMLFITHDFGVVAKMCDRVAVLYAGSIVEQAPVKDLFHSAAHWYTQGLIDSIPPLRSKAERLISIAGAPPKLGERPTGCRFADRCQHAQVRCREETPALRNIDSEHAVACWYPRR